MAYRTFAAIDIGSYELAIKIFEISSKNGIKVIDHIMHRIELGTDSYYTGKISSERIDELCRILSEFTNVMESYKVDDYKAYGTSAIRETKNSVILLDQLRTRTGIKIEVLSNSEQRFLDYKSVASKGQAFQDIIGKSTAFIDIGGGSIQLSLFDRESLVTTQNMRPGVLRMREELTSISHRSYQLEDLVEEMLCDRFESFMKMFVGDKKIQNVILIDDYVSRVLQKSAFKSDKKGYIEAKDFIALVDSLKARKSREIAEALKISEENIQLLHLSALMLKYMLNELDAQLLWVPGVSICDGMAYEYAEKNKLFSDTDKFVVHDFEQDILACARDINRRYSGIERRTNEREELSLAIFDHMKKQCGLSKRDRLLLQLAAILSECGRYISLSNVGMSAYNIIMATEIIGLSHLEREIVANIVKYITERFEYNEILGRVTTLDREAYLKIAKLTAILRLAEGIDISHKGKCDKIKLANKGENMVITVETNADMTLELGFFSRCGAFFEEVFNIKPVLKQKNSDL